MPISCPPEPNSRPIVITLLFIEKTSKHHFIRLTEEEPRGKRHYNQEYNIHQSEKTDVLLRVSRA